MNKFTYRDENISIKICDVSIKSLHTIANFLERLKKDETRVQVEVLGDDVWDELPPQEPIDISFDELSKLILDKNPQNKVSTNLQTVKNIKNIFTCHLNLNSFNLKHLKDTTHIIDLIKDRPLTTQKSLLGSISKCFQAFNLPGPKEIIEEMARLTVLIDAESSKRKFSEKEEANMITQEEIDALIEKFKAGESFEDRQNYVILNLYCKCDALRNDWAECLVGQVPLTETDNCYDWQDANLHLRNYKTSSVYGEKVIHYSDEINDIIKEFVLWRRTQDINSDFLLLNPSNYTMMTRGGLGKTIAKIFGKKVGSTLLRKFHVSQEIDADEVERQEEMASNMCHSTTVQRQKYCKK